MKSSVPPIRASVKFPPVLDAIFTVANEELPILLNSKDDGDKLPQELSGQEGSVEFSRALIEFLISPKNEDLFKNAISLTDGATGYARAPFPETYTARDPSESNSPKFDLAFFGKVLAAKAIEAAKAVEAEPDAESQENQELSAAIGALQKIKTTMTNLIAPENNNAGQEKNGVSGQTLAYTPANDGSLKHLEGVDLLTGKNPELNPFVEELDESKIKPGDPVPKPWDGKRNGTEAILPPPVVQLPPPVKVDPPKAKSAVEPGKEKEIVDAEEVVASESRQISWRGLGIGAITITALITSAVHFFGGDKDKGNTSEAGTPPPAGIVAKPVPGEGSSSTAQESSTSQEASTENGPEKDNVVPINSKKTAIGKTYEFAGNNKITSEGKEVTVEQYLGAVLAGLKTNGHDSADEMNDQLAIAVRDGKITLTKPEVARSLEVLDTLAEAREEEKGAVKQ